MNVIETGETLYTHIFKLIRPDILVIRKVFNLLLESASGLIKQAGVKLTLYQKYQVAATDFLLFCF